jgi:hypothetical protein
MGLTEIAGVAILQLLKETPMTTQATNSATAVNLLNGVPNLPASVWGTDKALIVLRLNTWLQGAQDIINNDYAKNFPTLNAPFLEMSDGRRYIRVDRVDNSGYRSRSIHVFIDKKTGDILKAASYKAPAKHARGNIFDASWGLQEMTPHGASYLR